MEDTIHPHPIDVHCDGCANIYDDFTDRRCRVYFFPETKWMNGRTCPMATHIEKKKEEVKIVNALKASKRAAKGK